MARLIAERADVIPVLAETFRAHGFEGTSLALITKATGLGKGSLYHFFPGGKEEMAQAVLAHIEAWFREQIFDPMRHADNPQAELAAMFARTAAYFEGGGRVCLVGLFALGDERDRFASAISGYFSEWIEVLATCLVRTGHEPALARAWAEETVAGLQGAIILSRSFQDRAVFARVLECLQRRITADAP